MRSGGGSTVEVDELGLPTVHAVVFTDAR
jgi:hypothetical protein